MTLQDWFPVITLVLGSTLTILGGLLSERYRTKASLSQAREEREIQQELARTTFRRENILQLQDAGQDLIKFTLQCFRERWPESPPTADPDQRQPQDTSEEAELARSTARIQVNKLASRLENEQDRKKVYELLDLSREALDYDDYKIAHAKFFEMQYKLSEANETILGPILRKTFGL
jgi:hypothetical protein